MSNVKEHLEELVMNSSVDLEEYNIYHYPNSYAIEAMIEIFSELPKNVLTFGEIVRLTEDYSSIHYEYLTTAELHALNALYPHWVDYDSLLNRSDNYLSNDLDESDWKNKYNNALSEYVIKNGFLVQVNPGHFGWEDYNSSGSLKYSKSQIVGAYNLKEVYWSEFAGTFVEADEKVGVEIDVLYSNGYSRKLRVEKGMAEIVKGITS